MIDTVLVVNVGSSSVKLSVLDADDAVVVADELGSDPSEADLERFFAAAGRPDAIGHRVVHGGSSLEAPTRVDDRSLALLDDAAQLAPLHDPPAIAMIRRLRDLHPEVPAVACFDTAFHTTLAPAATTYAIPSAWRDAGVRRYGFHGLSHAYASRRARELLDRTEPDRAPGEAHRLVVCHLGAGASLAAVRDGRSVDTTMGFTPLEGLVMASRSGDVDPGALLWLQDRLDLDSTSMAAELNHGSGLVGLAGTADLGAVIDRRDQGDEVAQLAVDVYVHRLRKAIAAMTASLGGIDTLVFTGGVGEHAPLIRRLAADQLGFLGIGIDPEGNEQVDLATLGDVEISAPGSRVRTLVVRAREDLEIARQTRGVLA